MIPCIEKDLITLPLCLEGVRRCVTNRVRNIYLVAPTTPAMLHFCDTAGVRHVDERTVLGIAPSELNIITTSGDRSGWLFQQLVKLSAAVGTCEHYLCIDADHVLLRPHTFLAQGGRTVFYMSSEQHRPYYRNIARLVPGLHLAPLSYVDHKMLFSRTRLRQLHDALGGPDQWVRTIVDAYDRTELSGFSEFELYGNFTPRAEKIHRPWQQLMLTGAQSIRPYDELLRLYADRRMSVTFPAYLR